MGTVAYRSVTAEMESNTYKLFSYQAPNVMLTHTQKQYGIN